MSEHTKKWIVVKTEKHYDDMHTIVKIGVRIRYNRTMEVRTLPDLYESWIVNDEAMPSDFAWSEGNLSCDCNRGQFFDHIDGVDTDNLSDEEDANAYPCGDDAYSVQLFNPLTKEVFYDGFEDDAVVQPASLFICYSYHAWRHEYGTLFPA